MKAIIISGHLRTFEQIYNTFDFKDTDIFINTYDELGYWGTIRYSNDDTHVNERKIDSSYIMNIFKDEDKPKIKDIYIESEHSKIELVKEFTEQMEKRKIWYARPFAYASSHMKRLSGLERFFSKKDKEYDIVMLMRPDFKFTEYNAIDINLIKKDMVYIEGTENYAGNNDWLSDFFIIGNERNLLHLKTIYISSFKRYIEEYKGEYDPHSYFKFLITRYFPKYSCINSGGNNNLQNTPNGYCIKV